MVEDIIFSKDCNYVSLTFVYSTFSRKPAMHVDDCFKLYIRNIHIKIIY